MVMCFFNMRRLVICMVLMVVLSTVHGQPVQPSSSDTDCPVDHLESKLFNIEDRLNRIETIISLMNNILIKENCTVDLASYGYDDSTKYGYIRTNGGSSEQIYFAEQIERYRGVNLVELDPTTCRTKNRQSFDTHASNIDRVQLLETLELATVGTIIIGVAADSAVFHENMSFQNPAGSYFCRYNMNLTGLQSRDKFAFIMQRGYPKKTLFQRKPRYGESLKMKIGVRGSTIYDVTFNRV